MKNTINMKNKIILSFLLSLFILKSTAQQLPVGSCGIVYIYDENGCRVKRVYFCNNGVDPYPLKTTPITKGAIPTASAIPNPVFNKIPLKNIEVQLVDALYPNPTTGKFFINFSTKIINATVTITASNGKVIQSFVANGFKIDFNLSGAVAGTYFVNIKGVGSSVTYKIIKE